MANEKLSAITGATGAANADKIYVQQSGATGPIHGAMTLQTLKAFVGGVTGATGVSGATGAIGVSGATGAGVTGVSGATGAIGVSGATGAIGVSGATGAIGVSGATGAGSSNIVINTQTDSYSTAIADLGKLIRMNKGTANTLTVSTNATAGFAVGDTIMVQQMGAGATTIAAAGGVTLERVGDTTLVLAGQYAFVTLVKTATDTWQVTGMLTSTLANMTGATGAIGVSGATGAIGVSGATGAGVTGATGAAGVTGATGAVGVAVVSIAVDAPATTLTTGDGKAIFRVPSTLNAKNLTGVVGHVCTVSSSGAPTVMIRNVTDSQDMLSTALTIDVSEKDSKDATTPAVINTTYDDVATGDEIAIDVDTAGTGTKGLIVELQFT